MAALSVDGIPMPALPNSADQINYDNTTSGLSATTVKGAVDELASEKQDKSDNSLQTTDKTIPGAINELKSGLTNYISVGGATLGEDTEITTGNVELQFPIPPKTGYAPIGVCGFNFQNRVLMSALSISGFAINSGICYAYGYTASNATVPSNARIDILYAKSI